RDAVPRRHQDVFAPEGGPVRLGDADLPDFDLGPVGQLLLPRCWRDRQGLGLPVSLDDERQRRAGVTLDDVRHLVPVGDPLVADLDDLVAFAQAGGLGGGTGHDRFQGGGEVGEGGREQRLAGRKARGEGGEGDEGAKVDHEGERVEPVVLESLHARRTPLRTFCLVYHRGGHDYVTGAVTGSEVTTSRAFARAQASVWSASSIVETSTGVCASMVRRMVSAMPRKPIRRSRKACTATSFAAFMAAGIVPPTRRAS